MRGVDLHVDTTAHFPGCTYSDAAAAAASDMRRAVYSGIWRPGLTVCRRTSDVIGHALPSIRRLFMYDTHEADKTRSLHRSLASAICHCAMRPPVGRPTVALPLRPLCLLVVLILVIMKQP